MKLCILIILLHARLFSMQTFGNYPTTGPAYQQGLIYQAGAPGGINIQQLGAKPGFNPTLQQGTIQGAPIGNQQGILQGYVQGTPLGNQQGTIQGVPIGNQQGIRFVQGTPLGFQQNGIQGIPNRFPPTVYPGIQQVSAGPGPIRFPNVKK